MTPERIGPYPIEREIGRGGMGVVYLGRDTRLDRRVAIKVLPEAFAADPQRLARFEREARLVASLNHPNIAGIYGIEEDAGHRFLALEYVEGDTLADRIARGPLALDEALELCRQLAAALEAAHEGGVVHRDLKPANIKVTPAGAVKVLDFGLAKGGAGAGSDSGSGMSNSPTLALAATGLGMILGTPGYMSPEQTRGRDVDKRADIWAFGCLLYECLTGRQAFAGETASDMVARILQGEPEWSALPARTPERVRGLLRRCLEKDARRRLRDIGDARIEIEDVQSVQSSSSSMVARGTAAPVSRRPFEWARLVAVALLAAAVAWFAPRAFRGPESAQPSRFTIPQPDDAYLYNEGVSPALSPDGRSLAFVTYDSNSKTQIWLRKLESTAARPIAGTNGVERTVFWSPDGRQIAFNAHDKLQRIPVAGGDAEVVCPVKSARGGSWNRDGVILIAPNPDSGIYRVAAGGGEPQPVTTLDSTRGETSHRYPQFLPDGRHFLFTVLPARAGKFDTYLGSLDSAERTLVLSAGSGLTWAPPDHLLFAQSGRLMAQEFDAGAFKLRGEPVSLGDVVSPTINLGGPIASAAPTGAMVYGTVSVKNTRLAWVDWTGKEVAPIPLAPGPYFLARGGLSPDDRRVALTRTEPGGESGIWIVDLERGVATRFTDEPGANASPKWSPDGTRIAYLWSDQSPQVIKIKSLSRDTTETFLETDPVSKRLDGWTPDGRGLIYSRSDPATKFDLWVLPLDGDRKPRPYLQTRFNELDADVSPDGRWITYRSDETGQYEIYVQSFPVSGGKYQVTTEGGAYCAWSSDGKYLYYGLTSDRERGREADVQSGGEFRLGTPRLADTFPKDVRDAWYTHQGRRLLATLKAGNDPTPSITVLLDGLPGSSAH